MKRFILPGILMLSILTLSGQKNESPKRDFCGSYRFLQNRLSSNPQLKADFEKRKAQEAERDKQAFKSGYTNTQATAIYTIPMVFHILHLGGAENISDAQVIDAVNILNRDFRKLNGDTVNIDPVFKPLASDTKIEFRLATKDTNGNCTNGIVHYYDADTYWDQNPGEYKYTWNSSKYLNVYVVKSFGPGAWFAAYSSFPGTNTNAMDVIVSLHDYIGSIGTGNVFNSRILTHEVGHWFNLHHVWGDTQCNTVCGDDGVNDTPVTKGYDYCPTGNVAICTQGVKENYQNYMEYSYCELMFTTGQSAWMAAALNSTVSGRNNLSSNANLIATGVINPSGICAPVAAFYNSQGVYTVCTGKPISFKDFSYNAPITGRNWSASGNATVTAPSASITNVIFPAAGTHTVSLVVANNTGSATTTRTVQVIDAAPDFTSSVSESFEAVGIPPKYKIINYDQDVAKWEQTGQGAATGSKSYYIMGLSNPPASLPDVIETPAFDFATDPNAMLTFKYAYAKFAANWTDVFKVQASKDCGGTWVDIYQPSNSSMAAGSGGVSNFPFIPTPSQFKTYTVTDHPNFTGNFYQEPNVRFRFWFKEDTLQGYGNNIYIDDINFSMIDVGINELTKSYALKMYPNPTSGQAYVSITLSDAALVSYFTTDITGKMVEERKILNAQPGNCTLTVNPDKKLSKGIYLVNVEVNGQRMVRKLMVE